MELRKATSNNFGILTTWKEKKKKKKKERKRKISKCMDAGSNNWNERGGIDNMQWIEKDELRWKIKLKTQNVVKTLIL